MAAYERVALRRTIADRLGWRMRKGLYIYSWRFGLRRTLAEEIEPPQAKIPLHVRPFESGDEEALFGHRLSGTDIEDAREIRYRLEYLEDDIQTPFVAIDETTGMPCYLQWLIGADQNAILQAKPRGFPILARNEALLENAYTPPAYRGKQIMAAAMYLIAERSSHFGADYAITFVAGENIPSLKGCKRAGFRIYMVHEQQDYCFGLRTRSNFTVLREGDPRSLLLGA